jgi:DNA-binding LacI/PurR family transcriptional regulator
MQELGYVPNRAARSLVVNRMGVLALLRAGLLMEINQLQLLQGQEAQNVRDESSRPRMSGRW